MIAKALVFVCAAFGLVAGSCFEVQVPQPCGSQIVNLPVSTESSSISVPSFQTIQSVPSISDNVFSSGCSDVSFGGSSQVVAVPVSSSSSSDNSFSDLFSSGSFSSGLQAATNGPESASLQVIEAPAVTLPAQEGPAVVLSSPPIPAPRVLSQRCICTKTIVKPQVYQRTVVVPKIQRYIKRTVTPVVENVSYKSSPIAQPESSSASVVVAGSGSGSGFGSSTVVVSSGSGSSFGSSSPSVVVSSGSGSSFGYVPSSSQRYISVPVSSSTCQKVC